MIEVRVISYSLCKIILLSNNITAGRAHILCAQNQNNNNNNTNEHVRKTFRYDMLNTIAAAYYCDVHNNSVQHTYNK